MCDSVALDLAHDRARNHVARREIPQRMITLHESLARSVDQMRAFPAQRFGKQKTRRAPHEQRCGMELHEFEIGDFRPGAESHRDAIAGSYIGIGGLAEDSSQTAGCKQNRSRANLKPRSAMLRPTPRRPPRAPSSDTIRSVIMDSARNSTFGNASRFAVQRARDLLSGGIAVRVQNPVAAVRSFAREKKSGPSRSNSAPQSMSCSIAAGAFLDQHAHGRPRRTARRPQTACPARAARFVVLG